MDRARFNLDKIYSKLPVILFDTLSIPLAWFLAYWFRNNMMPLNNGPATFYAVSALSILATVQTVCYYYFKVYRGLWRFSSLNDVARILRAVATATVIVIPLLYFTSLLQYIPRSVLPLYAMILIAMLCGARLLFRSHWDNKNAKTSSSEVKRVLIVGAGHAGESLIRELKRTPSYVPVGLVDDSASKRGLEVHGVCVLGTIPKLPALVAKYKVDLIFIAIPSVSSARMRTIVTHCEACNIPFHTLPGLQALASGQVAVNALRKVNIEDLLGRDQVTLSWDKISTHIQGRRILVTGGGGSIGSELCRQIMILQIGRAHV